jgi:hypothetical protein
MNGGGAPERTPHDDGPSELTVEHGRNARNVRQHGFSVTEHGGEGRSARASAISPIVGDPEGHAAVGVQGRKRVIVRRRLAVAMEEEQENVAGFGQVEVLDRASSRLRISLARSLAGLCCFCRTGFRRRLPWGLTGLVREGPIGCLSLLPVSGISMQVHDRLLHFAVSRGSDHLGFGIGMESDGLHANAAYALANDSSASRSSAAPPSISAQRRRISSRHF